MTRPGLNYTGSGLSGAGGLERGDMQELSGDMMTPGDSWGVTGDILPPPGGGQTVSLGSHCLTGNQAS